jgi:Co/Zn/Cd efflux system component
MKPLSSAMAFALFAVLFCCAVASEAWGRFRHGSEWESGDGIGRAEDYL